MPLQQTSGNVTQDAYGGGKAVVPTYVENVFSTYLYTGTQATKTITNNIDLADNGGLVWFKDRTAARSHALFDTVRGVTSYLRSNTTGAAGSSSNALTSFNNNGFTLGNDSDGVNTNYPSGDNFASWTFRKQPKFFDIVTYTGNGSYQTINHNLGSVPGCIIVKRTDNSGAWNIYHIGLGGGSSASGLYLLLSNIAGVQSDGNYFPSDPTSTNFTVGPTNDQNASGGTFVAYIFSIGGTGGFGLTGMQDIIKCGSFTTNSSGNATISLGWEPQYFLYKRYSGSSDWYVFDEMRGFNNTFTQALYPNSTSSEGNISPPTEIPTATGINVIGDTASSSYIYIAIRRGPMATPTTGTSVFSPNTGTPSTPNIVTTGFPVDMVWADSNGAANGPYDLDRLRGDSTTNGNYLLQYRTNAESNNSSYGIGFDSNTYIADNFTYNVEGYSGTQTYWNFAIAPGFFDEVCYTGNGSNMTIPHNLTVAPQLVFVKPRYNPNSSTTNWVVGTSAIGFNNLLTLNNNSAAVDVGTAIFTSNPTASNLYFSSGARITDSTGTNVAYLFATVTGVSYVGSYTGNGTGQSIACGFGASGARFILIKRTDSTGNWYVFDSANGLTSSSSPYFILNTASTPTTGNNGVYASSGGFTLTSNASSTVNISSASYIFLSIA